ncbi:hypothetical protein [Brucella pseudogrignonensis]|uniref:hypothetical protein n=1 Tax=Brucella pseudogrignonensis TaxID=419475 RepID=UPI000CFDA717|nr:hypothetical protein [Brucella pseudogrignonensis]MQP38634.1 hypothetical protein [Ochrobactrum sp. MYb237]PQZ43253.1 hypothetical protein CQ059_04770 [Brucella pseudogrignonensis]PRA43000.1 hypothetical protein CQ063_01255 [Brucella pseudogrignonensis]PRA72532.1 hypothetical protein CQ055_04325 [Brucella pseudogrignonensis]
MIASPKLICGMNDNILPILQVMISAANDADRALVLLVCPIRIMIQYQPFLERTCSDHCFEAGSEYLTCFYAAMNQTRRNGELVNLALNQARQTLLLLTQNDGGDA